MYTPACKISSSRDLYYSSSHCTALHRVPNRMVALHVAQVMQVHAIWICNVGPVAVLGATLYPIPFLEMLAFTIHHATLLCLCLCITFPCICALADLHIGSSIGAISPCNIPVHPFTIHCIAWMEGGLVRCQLPVCRVREDSIPSYSIHVLLQAHSALASSDSTKWLYCLVPRCKGKVGSPVLFASSLPGSCARRSLGLCRGNHYHSLPPHSLCQQMQCANMIYNIKINVVSEWLLMYMPGTSGVARQSL